MQWRKATRYGLTIGDVQDVIQSAIGGQNVTFTVEKLEELGFEIWVGKGEGRAQVIEDRFAGLARDD